MTTSKCSAVILLLTCTAISIALAAPLNETGIVSDICSADERSVTNFYHQIRNTNQEGVQYPDFQPTFDSIWDIQTGSHVIISFYENFHSDILAHLLEIQPEFFMWCIHLYRSNNGSTLHGCIRGNETSGSNDFLQLGLLKDVEVDKVSPYFITIKHGKLTGLLQGAVVSVTLELPWLSHTIGIYYTLVIAGLQPVKLQIVNFPTQEVAFLVKNERKVFECDIIGSHSTHHYLWSHDGDTVQNVIDVDDVNCTREGDNFEGSCSKRSFPVSYSLKEEDIGDCKLNGLRFRTAKSTLSLAFSPPSVTDIGEYKCSVVKRSNSQEILISKSLFISVLFMEFPSVVTFILGESVHLPCVVKAPSNSSVYWTFNGKRISGIEQLQNRAMGTNRCVQTISAKNQPGQNDFFTTFHTTLQLCSATLDNLGRYTCVVEYSIPSVLAIQTAQLHLDIENVKNSNSASMVSGAPANIGVAKDLEELKMAAEAEQQELSCLLNSNITKRAEVYSTVRNKHGFPDSPVRTFQPTVLRTQSVRCFSQSQCPGADHTWCFNLYHPTKFIEVCLDSASNVINMTEDAATLGLNEYFTVGENCPRGPCLTIQEIPFFLNRGLITCTSQSETCVAKSFTTVVIQYVSLDTEPPEIVFHNSSSELVLGQQNIFLFTALYPTEPIEFFLGFGDGGELYSNGSLVSSIPQNGPFCEVIEGCLPASVAYDDLRQERIRVYSCEVAERGCPAKSRTYYSWLVIDDARESDAYTQFVFSASAYVYQPYPIPTRVTNEFHLNLIPVSAQVGSGGVDLLAPGE